MTITFDLNKTASFDVDAQKTFTELCPDELPVPDGLAIVAELNAQAELTKLRLGSKEAHSAEAIWVADDQHPVLSMITGDNVDVRWPKHAVPGTLGFQLLDGLPHPTHYDYFVWKGVELDMHPYGACYHDMAEHLSTGAIEYLRQNAIETVVVGGLALDYCVKTTALQLQRAGFQTVVNLVATRPVAADTGEIARQELSQAGVLLLNSVSELAS